MELTEQCNWCERSTASGFTRGGIDFCDDNCADEYEEEWGLIGE